MTLQSVKDRRYRLYGGSPAIIAEEERRREALRAEGVADPRCKWCRTDQPEGSTLVIRNGHSEEGPYLVCWDVWLCWVRFRQDKEPWLVGTLTEEQLNAL